MLISVFTINGQKLKNSQDNYLSQIKTRIKMYVLKISQNDPILKHRGISIVVTKQVCLMIITKYNLHLLTPIII